MKYTNFFLENYKGIKDRLDFNLDMEVKTPHCIIGNNESGKTTILQGIELISKLCKGEEIKNGTRQAIKPKDDYFKGKVKLGATLSCDRSTIDKHEKLKPYISEKSEIVIKVEFTYIFEKASFIKNENIIELCGSVITAKQVKQKIFEILKEQAPEVIYYDDFKFTVPKVIRFLETGVEVNNKTYLERSDNLQWQKIFDDILKGHGSGNAGTFQSDVVDWHQNSNNDPSIADSRIRNMGKYLDKMLKEWLKNNKNNIDSFEISKKQSQKEEDKKFSDYQISIVAGENSYQMNERSKGLQWSFCFHILTRIRKNRHEAGFIFLLDEPANNLHIRPQNEMLNHLNELCNDDCTVIYSTHSPGLICTEGNCYEHTFIAKNNSEELQETDIHLYKLMEVTDDIEIRDIEPILAKLSYEDIKGLSDEKNEKEKWKAIIEVITSGDKLSRLAQVSTISNFCKNVIKDIF
jgi:predicted ATPase